VLKLLEQLHHYVQEALFPTGLQALPILNFQSPTTPTRSHLRLDARGEEVWEITQQYQGGDRRDVDGSKPRPYSEKGSFL
jgi:hypothetical protein